MKLILASQSPRRKELLTQVLLELQRIPDFEIIVADIDESPHPSEAPEKYAERMAHEKATAVLKMLGDKQLHQQPATSEAQLIIAADTIVVLDDQILGKPKDADDAKLMLQNLSGKTHSVMTGICLLEPATSDQRPATISHITTNVTFRKLSEKEITDYIATGEPMDKAGAYAIQGGAKNFVTKIEGSWSNVVGLPTEWLKGRLLATSC